MKAASKKETAQAAQGPFEAGHAQPEGSGAGKSSLRRRKVSQKEHHDSKMLLPGTTLFRSIPFLLLFSFTVMNAFFYVYLTLNDFPAIDQKTADSMIQETFGKDYAYFSSIEEFLTEIRSVDEPSYPQFRSSLANLNENINRFGFYTGSLFGKSSFRFSRGGIYWSPPLVEGRTSFKPQPDRKATRSRGLTLFDD